MAGNIEVVSMPLRNGIWRVLQAALASATLETIVAHLRAHTFHPTAAIMLIAYKFVFYFIMLSVAALVTSSIKPNAAVKRKFVFFGLVILPLILLDYAFFNNISFYTQGGSPLIQDHSITTAGIESLIFDVGIFAGIAFVAMVVYFRAPRLPA
jgi:hypothetical protein